MVLSSQVAVAVANLSANFCQYIACNPEMFSSEDVLHLICCFPFQHFRRFTLCLCTFFCSPAGDLFFASSEDLHRD